MGTEVRLIGPQYITPFVNTNKNVHNDTEAFVEAASWPTMRFVPVKSVERQDIQEEALHAWHPAVPSNRADQPDERPARRTRSCDLAVTGSVQRSRNCCAPAPTSSPPFCQTKKTIDAELAELLNGHGTKFQVKFS
jgi:hypothetical protein